MYKYVFGWENDNDMGLKLIERIKSGNKTATCSFKKVYEVRGVEPPPYSRLNQIVEVWDKYGHMHCKVKVYEVYEVCVSNPGEQLAKEDFNGSVEEFINDCKELWADCLPSYPFDPNAILIAERFELID